MNDLFLNIPMIGELYYHHIHLFYDEPLIFSCATKAFQYYLVVAVPSSSSADASWLVAPISSGRLVQAERNLIEIRKLITNPETLLYIVDLTGDNVSVEEADPSSLSDNMLPISGAYLDYNDNQELAKPDSDPDSQALVERRDIIELSLEKDNEHQQEIPCLSLANTLSNIQNLVYALGIKDGKTVGAIPRNVKENCQLSITGMYAASVGVRLKSDDLCDLSCETSLTSTLKELNHLLEILSDKEVLQQYLSEHNPRIAYRLKTFIHFLVRDNVGVNIKISSPDNSSFKRHFSTQELKSSLSYIDNEVISHIKNETYTGELTGVDVDKNTFSFITSEGSKIHGSLDSIFKNHVFKVSQHARIEVEIRIDEENFVQNEKYYYTLKALTPLIEEDE